MFIAAYDHVIYCTLLLFQTNKDEMRLPSTSLQK